MLDIQFTKDELIVVDGSRREVFEIVSSLLPDAGLMIIRLYVDETGRLWRAAWVQVSPSVMQAYAWCGGDDPAEPDPSENAERVAPSSTVSGSGTVVDLHQCGEV